MGSLERGEGEGVVTLPPRCSADDIYAKLFARGWKRRGGGEKEGGSQSPLLLSPPPLVWHERYSFDEVDQKVVDLAGRSLVPWSKFAEKSFPSSESKRLSQVNFISLRIFA